MKWSVVYVRICVHTHLITDKITQMENKKQRDENKNKQHNE
jgi:hypothetical protein